MQLTDDLLVDALTSAESTIKSRFSRRLRSLGQRFDVDDLYQTTCLKAHQGRDNCQAESVEQLRHWILTIAKHTCETAVTENLGVAKRSVRLEKVAIGIPTSDSRDGYQPGDDTGDALANAAIKAECQHALACVDRLPKLQQRAIRMRFVEQMEYQEIAEQLGATVQSIRSLVSRGLEAARGEVDQYSLPGFED